MFSQLPRRAEDVKSSVTSVNLEDVECVTVTVVKVRGPPWYLQIRKGIDENDQINVAAMLKSDPVQRELAEEDFTAKYCHWESADWEELEWEKVKDLQVRELLAGRQTLARIAQQKQCLSCPNFLRHVGFLDDISLHTTLIEDSMECNMTSGLSRKISWFSSS
jgi:antiviral helicase SKI2